jgi:hypothetical protein
MDLETASGLVHAAIADNNGAVRIETSPVGQDSWTASPTTVPVGGGPVPSAQIVLQGHNGWLLENDRTVVGGARLTQGRWVPWQPPCSASNGPATLAASTSTDLVAVCDEGLWGGSSPPVTHAYLSSDGGMTFHLVTTPVPSSSQYAGPVASSTQAIVLGTSIGGSSGNAVLLATFDGGTTWVQGWGRGTGTWQEVGFTSTAQGVAILAGQPGTMLMTTDGGHTWRPVAFQPTTGP